MKIMKKIVAIMAVALLLCSMLPMTVLADTYELATSLEVGDTVVLAYTSGSMELNGISTTSTKYGLGVEYSGSPVGAYPLTVVAGASDGTYAFQTSAGTYLTWTSGNSLNTATSVNANSSWNVSFDGDNAVITNANTSTRKLQWNANNPRFACYTSVQTAIQLYKLPASTEPDTGCDHDSLICGDTCPECGEYTKEHKYGNNCVAECENGCGTANPNYADHVYVSDYDVSCNVCSATREVTFPEADSELTIAEINTIAGGMDSGVATDSKYYVTGEITEIYNTTYGNMYITDGTDTLLIYGTYDADGTNRFDAMADQPEVGQTVKLYGKIGNYNGTNQMQYAWIIEVTGGCEHEYEYECSTNCSLCGEGARDVACVNSNPACQDGLCTYCGNDVAGLGHAYDSDYDADCNYCGEVRDVPEAPAYATIDFSTTDQRTELDTEHQVWVESALVFTNNKGSSTSNVVDYSNPVRLYKSSEVVIAFPGMTSLVIDATGIGTNYLWEATLDAAGLSYEVSEQVYTITFAEAVDSITLTMANQGRANSITAYGSSEEEESAISYAGASISEDVSGLAMQFKIAADGIAVKEGTFVQADYTNATVNGAKLLEVGVIASNGTSEITIKGERMYDLEEDVASFAFRIINIPEANYGDEITMTPYYIVEIDGVATTIYGEAQTGSYNQYAG